jgi:hypothetical protein
MRPGSLSEVADLTLRGESFHFCLRSFLDEFYLDPNSSSLNTEPERLDAAFPDTGKVYDAYLAATAEALAGRQGFDTPAWAYNESRKLRHPWFALSFASLRAVLLVESPAAFRSRNLFVSENALSRA